MKKIILFAAVAVASMGAANAQKFEGGEKNLEVQFNPLSTTDSPLGISGIRYRMFNSESSAIRIGLNIGGTNVQGVMSQQTPTLGSDGKEVIIPELYQTNKSFDFSIRPGYEKHFAGTDRLSPYVGGEIVFATGSSTLTKEFHNSNNADDVSKPENWQTWEMTVKNGYTAFGVNGLAGVDFYFTDNLYMGAEISFGFMNMKFKDRETEAGNADAWKYSEAAQLDPDFYQAQWNNEGTAVEYSTIIGPGDLFDENGNEAYKMSGWGPSVQTSIRLGWLF